MQPRVTQAFIWNDWELRLDAIQEEKGTKKEGKKKIYFQTSQLFFSGTAKGSNKDITKCNKQSDSMSWQRMLSLAGTRQAERTGSSR